jgi:hypothetical protein
LNILPVFVSSTDLHLQTSPPVNETLNYAGTPISGITSDIDAQTRNFFTPDMGADEFRGRGSWLVQPAHPGLQHQTGLIIIFHCTNTC